MRYTAIIILLLVSFVLKAQESNSGNKWPVFKQVSHPFMPTITSKCFFFSEDGLIWFSTAQGLTSFDGSEVVYYSSLLQANQYGLNRIFALTEDNDHNFYLGTSVGLIYYDRTKKSFTELPYIFLDTHQQKNIGFDALYYDNGVLYAGSGLNGMFVYDEHSRKINHYNLEPRKPDSWEDRTYNTVSGISKNPSDKNKLWVATFNGIFLFDKINRTFHKNFEIINPVYYLSTSAITGADTSIIPKTYDVEKMDIADDSTIWFNSWTLGFGKYNTHTGKVKMFLQNERLKTPSRNIGFIMPRFAKLEPGKYLLGIYDYKAGIFDTRKETATYFNITENNVNDEQTRFVANDKKGNIWLLRRGVLYISVPGYLRLQSEQVPNLTSVNYSKPELRGIYFDDATKLFYGTFYESIGVHVFDSSFNPKNIIPTPIVNNYYNYNSTVNARITKDGTGRLWTVGWENYIKFPGEKKFRKIEEKFKALAWLKTKGEFTDVATTRYGNILMKNINGIIYHINCQTLLTDTIRFPPVKASGVEVKTASVWYDKERNLVYLTRNEGIAQYNLYNKLMRIIPYSSLFGNLPANQGVCAPTLDAAGRIWLMIPRYGVRIIDPKSLLCTDSLQYGTKGLLSGDYTAIIGGSNHYVIFRSQNGIVVYDYVKQQSFLFDHTNGLSSPDNMSLLYSNGYLVIGQSNSFEYFKLSNLDNYSPAVTAYVNTIIADTATVFTRTGIAENNLIQLAHYQNTVNFSFSAADFFFPERIEYAYHMEPLENGWNFTDYFNRKITYSNLPPGRYKFFLKSQIQGGNWDTKSIEYTIIIESAWWQTILFKVLIGLIILGLLFYFIFRRIRIIRQQELQKRSHEKELVELEAKALRSQMNPHFIFNCLNSIKSLIQQHEEEKSVTYLTTFSKLIRTLFNNADKKEISLFDEIETCRFYLQLEAMRFDSKFSYQVNIDDSVDLKSIHVPALIVQPFIENAIWHGIVPRNNGGEVILSVVKNNATINIIIDDNGIGRAYSKQNKSASALTHQSKGVNLTEARIHLNNLLQQRQAELEIIDKKDTNGSATGTTVIIKIKEELS